MLYKVRSLGLQGISGYEVTAECDLASGLPNFDMVGYRVHTGYTSKKGRTPPRLEGFFLLFLNPFDFFRFFLAHIVNLSLFGKTICFPMGLTKERQKP